MCVRIYKLFIIAFILCGLATSAYSSSDWKATLKVSGGGLSNYCIFGINGEATDGADNSWDVPAPPGSLSDTYIYIYFPHPEWSGIFDRFRQDIKAPDLPKEWTFKVDSNISGELTIEWPDLKNAIPDKDAVLVDVDGGGGNIDMQTSSSFVFGNTGLPRRFLVKVSEGIPAPKPPDSLVGQVARRWKKVSLYWKRNRELDLAGYNVYRSTTPGSGYQRINYSLVLKPKYVDKQITKGTTYYYVVTAVNAAGGESGYSNEVEIVIDTSTKYNPKSKYNPR
jgi:hypothetical protein